VHEVIGAIIIGGFSVYQPVSMVFTVNMLNQG